MLFLRKSLKRHNEYPQLTAIGSNGEYVVTWHSWFWTGGGWDIEILVRKFNADGTVNGSAQKFEATGRTDAPDLDVSLATLGGGAFAITWMGYTTTGYPNIFVQQFNADGSFAQQSPSLSADTGSSATDFITRTASQTITASLQSSLGTGEILYGSVDGGSTWTDITNRVNGTSLNWTGATLQAGTSSIQLKVTDSAGNDSTTYSQTYTLDTTAPTATTSTVTIGSSGNAVVQSTETGTAYLVNTNVSVSTLSQITSAADNQWNTASITSANTATNLAATGLANGSYKVYTVDTAGNLSAASTDTVTVDSSLVSLGSYGNLIAPVSVDGHTYYYWDRSGDGTQANLGSLNGGIDTMTHDQLDTLFNSGSDTTNSARTAILNGITVLLPTLGMGSPVEGLQPGTSVTGSSINATYDDLLALWDAHNGTAATTGGAGTPSQWHASGTDSYWSAMANGSGAHYTLDMSQGSVGSSADTAYHWVALEVMPG